MNRANTLGGWFPALAGGWPDLVELLLDRGSPWLEEHAITDLRWHDDQGKRIPPRRQLVKRWRWTDWAVRRMLRDEKRWRDPKRLGRPLPFRTDHPRATPAPPQDHPSTTPQPTQNHPAGASANADNQQEFSQDHPSTTPGPTQDHPSATPDPSTRAVDPHSHSHPHPPSPERENARGGSGRRSSLSRGEAIEGQRIASGLGVASVSALSAIWGRQAQPTDKAALGLFVTLWATRGQPDPQELAAQVELVARWAREAPDSENDIRGIDSRGERWGPPDRSRIAGTILDPKKFGDRLESARRWESSEDDDDDPDPRRKVSAEQKLKGLEALEQLRELGLEGGDE